MVFVMPFIFATNLSFPFLSLKLFLFYAVVEILTALWIYVLVIDSSFRLNKKTYLYFIPVILFIFWMTIAGILAVNPHLSFWSTLGRGTGLITLYHCLLFAFIISSLVKHNGVNFIYKLMNWFIHGGLILAISVWCGNEGFNMFYLLKDSQGGGLMGNSSLAAAYLMFVLFFAVFLFASKNNNSVGRWWLGIIIGTILFSPLFVNIYGFLTGHGLLGSARGATLGIIVSIGVAFMLCLSFSKKKIFKILGIIGMLIGIIIFSYAWIQLETPNTKLHNKFAEVATGGTRFIFADIAKKAMNEHPWFGYGPENYSIAFQNNFNPEMALSKYNSEIWTDRAHNFYYEIGSTGGYPSIIFYSLFLMSLLYGIYRLRNKEEFYHIQVAILGGLIVGYVFQNLFVFDTPASLMALFLLAGIIFAANDNLGGEKYTMRALGVFTENVLPIILSIACLFSLFYFVLRPIDKVLDYHEYMNASIVDNNRKYVDLLEGSSIGEDWDVGGMADDINKLYIADPLKIKNDSVLRPNAIKDIKELLQYLEIVQSKNQSDVRLDVTIAELYISLNFFSDTPYSEDLANHMFKYLNEAQVISPTNPGIYWAKAQVYIWERNFKGAEDTYEKAIALDPSIPDSHMMLIKVAKIIGDQRTYNEAISQAEKDIPDFKLP